MMRNSKYNLVPYEVIERAITGDTAALLAVQERNKAYIGRLSGGNADMKERLNEKLLMDVMKFRLDYQPPSKRAQTDRRLAPSLNYGVFCYAVGFEKSCIHAALQKQNEWRQGEYSYPSKWRSTA